MRTYLTFLTVTLVTSALIGCATYRHRVLPRDDGSYTMITNSVSESMAYDGALKEGEEYCQVKNKQFVVVSQKSKYQGMDKQTKAMVGLAGAVLSKRGTYSAHSGSTMDDYKVTMNFKCK